MVIIFGTSEYALRFFPLVCSIISIFAFWFITSRYLNKRATFFAVAFFSISGLLIEFSSEVKQYSCDVLVGILALIILSLLRKHERLGYASAIGYGLLGAILIWLSHPAIFFFASIGIAITYDFYSKNLYDKAKLIAIIGVLWIISFLLFYTTSLTSLTSNQYLLDSWRNGFPPSLSKPLSVLEWTISALLGIFRDPGGVSAFGLGAFLYVIGSISLYRRDKVVFMSLVLPLLLTLFASFLSKYPFSNRLILFLLPLLLIPIGEGIEQVLQLLAQSQFRLSIPFFVIILFFQPFIEVKEYIEKPKLKEEIKPVIEHVHDNWQEGDIIYVYYGAYRPFKYYQENFGFQDSDYILGIEARYQWVDYLPDLNRLQDYDRVWLIFSHVHSGNGVNEEHLMINWLDRTGAIQKDWFPRAGASAYLYEFD
jgi:hypothetical protein